MKLTIKSTLPDNSISHFVHSFWMLENKTGKDIPSTVLANGMVDMSLMKMSSENWKMLVRGIDAIPSQVTITADTKMFAIGFKLLAVEYLFGKSIVTSISSLEFHSKHIATFFVSGLRSKTSAKANFFQNKILQTKIISSKKLRSMLALRQKS